MSKRNRNAGREGIRPANSESQVGRTEDAGASAPPLATPAPGHTEPRYNITPGSWAGGHFTRHENLTAEEIRQRGFLPEVLEIEGVAKQVVSIHDSMQIHDSTRAVQIPANNTRDSA